MSQIVKLRPDHFSALHSFFQKINSDAVRNNFHPHEFDEENARRVSHYKGRDLYFGLVHEDGTVAAYGMLRGWDEGYDTPSLGIVVGPEWQGAGYGREMMVHLIKSARDCGAKRIILKVKQDNTRAKTVYEKVGFRHEILDENFYRGILDLS